MSLVVTRALGLCTIQDLGRPGRMHEGLPRGGALVPSLLARSNRAARNADDAAAIEVLGAMTLRATEAIDVGTDGGARTLQAGDEIEITSEPRRVTYLAIRGGVDAPIVLGGRGAHLSAGLGAPLTAGTRIAAGSASLAHTDPEPMPARDTIRVIAGPDAFPPDALALLVSAPYRILPASDRVGTRLAGPALPRSTAAESSRPMVRGALEVPRDGQPIVLGPEHPTTGGYPVIAVIAHDDLDAFFAIRLGGPVHFVRRS